MALDLYGVFTGVAMRPSCIYRKAGVNSATLLVLQCSHNQLAVGRLCQRKSVI